MNWRVLIRFQLFLAAVLLSSLSYAEIVWIDVRSTAEHIVDNIEGDTRVSYGEIVERVNKEFPDRDTEIRLYCRSGGRADKAMSALKEAGYTNVSNAGGIDDARKERELDR